jgi:microcystin synthetase protein McyE
MRRALTAAGVTPQQVGYIEAHGTGTPLGDPIELRALGAVFGEREEPLLRRLGEDQHRPPGVCGGRGGLIKTVLALQHGIIPPHLHFQTPNPHVDWETVADSHCPRAATPWEATRRIAGVSSFGFSGTNAHVVVEGWDGALTPLAPSLASGRGGTEHSLGQPRIGDWSAPDGPHPPAPHPTLWERGIGG